jgi:hypothetical protein
VTTPDRTLATAVADQLAAGEGVLRLLPTWIPRSFLLAGRRLKLHPDDIYPFGPKRGGISERWLSSTTVAANEGAPADEGLSTILQAGHRLTLREACAALPERLLGPSLAASYGRWPALCKLLDYAEPVPLHIHQNRAQAALVGQEAKPEAYYFPPQMNAQRGGFPYTFFGLEPGTTKAQVRRALEIWEQGDNGILDLSRAYRLRPGTGWLVPPGILHAPGTLVTYEPQWGSDVFAMYQSMVGDRAVSRELLVKDVPKERQQDLDYLVEQLDWQGNVNPHFKQTHYREPVTAAGGPEGPFEDRRVVYGPIGGESLFSARELTVRPGGRAVLRDGAASGLIAVQGHGRIAGLPLATPVQIRFGDATEDEVFISYEAACRGVEVVNTGAEPLVTLRYFGPDHPDAA